MVKVKNKKISWELGSWEFVFKKSCIVKFKNTNTNTLTIYVKYIHLRMV